MPTIDEQIAQSLRDVLREVIATEPDAAKAEAMHRRVSELQQHLALRLEKLRSSGSL